MSRNSFNNQENKLPSQEAADRSLSENENEILG